MFVFYLKKKKHNFSYLGIKELHFTFTFHLRALEKEMATHSSVLAWRIPGTRGVWWAGVYGVAQNWTRLNRLSISSSGDIYIYIYICVCVCVCVYIYIYISEKAMAPHSSTRAWKIPWMEEPGRLQSMGSLRVRHD